MTDLEKYKSQLQNAEAEAVVTWALQEFGPHQVALASSLGVEDQVLTDMLVRLETAPRVFTLDTGRLANETHAVMQATVEQYHLAFEVYAPDPGDLAKLVATHGPNGFYHSVEDRKLCCEVRKLRPLRKALSTVRAWICGLRQEQSITRRTVDVVEWDAEHGIYKINPLYQWTEQQVWEYVRKHQVPYNTLHDQGYPSIGCAPCTRAVAPGEDIRAGRWWWESPEHKECGLHGRAIATPEEKRA